jgi:hypothetical protein
MKIIIILIQYNILNRGMGCRNMPLNLHIMLIQQLGGQK